MTLIAGIFSRKNFQIPETHCAALRQTISRNCQDPVNAFRDHRSYFVTVDIGAFNEETHRIEPDGTLSLVAGEPLLKLRDEKSRANGRTDLALIHEEFMKDEWEILRLTQGTFCAIHYQPKTGTLSLVADKLGIRPLYYWADEDTVVFATALRVLEALDQVPKKMNLRAVTEIIGLGVPLSDRTPYVGIRLLRPAEIVQITEPATSRSCYWRWDAITTARGSEQEHLTNVSGSFHDAVDRRIPNDDTTIAYLSGGLDSRCVVAALADKGVQSRTFNFARAGTQDQSFGDEFALRMNTIHTSLPKQPGDTVPDYSTIMARVLETFRDSRESPADRPGLVWSGEGGSVLLGHVHMSESIVEHMRAGEIDAAIEEYLQNESVHVPTRLFKPQFFDADVDIIKEGIREELNQFHCEDAGRNFYLFLMHNDQRRKLFRHFENMDIHRLEFQLPFFDSRLIESIMATPLDACLRHRFYTKLLTFFPPAVTAVPWQVYPGHEPCPVPVSKALSYQWDEKHHAVERASRKRTLLQQAAELLSAADFPNKILSKRNLRMASWMHTTGWRDYEYVLEAARICYTYWQKCTDKDLPQNVTTAPASALRSKPKAA
jgi:asparagine synthase (glutamine-hydrolysing)